MPLVEISFKDPWKLYIWKHIAALATIITIGFEMGASYPFNEKKHQKQTMQVLHVW